ncbi:MAG: YbaK/EbsC family protein [Bacilli bacterium]
MAIEKVKEYFKKFNKEKDVIELKESSATVHDAAIALGCDEAHIAKTMSYIVNEKPILIVLAGDTFVDNSKFKQQFFCKAKMIPIDLLDELVGHKAGGVCPFAIKDGVLVYLDEYLKRFEYVYPACGSSNSAIKLTIEELEKYSNYKEWIDVGKQKS